MISLFGTSLFIQTIFLSSLTTLCVSKIVKIHIAYNRVICYENWLEI